jgi:hypothetical protein
MEWGENLNERTFRPPLRQRNLCPFALSRSLALQATRKHHRRISLTTFSVAARASGRHVDGSDISCRGTRR